MRRPGLLLVLAALVGLAATPASPRGFTAVGAGGAAATPISYPFRFGYVTDTHINWPTGGGGGGGADTLRNSYCFGKVVDTLNALGADFCVHGGDWAEDLIYYESVPAAGDSFLAITGRADFTWYPILGNHEAIGADTLAERDPYHTARQYFGPFNGVNYYKVDHKNLRLIFLQNNADLSVDEAGDYRVNNPTSYAAPTGGTTGVDWDGIDNPASPQRQALASWTRRSDVGSRWILTFGHRGIYGANTNEPSRHNADFATRGDGYMKAIEDSLPEGRRALNGFGDQHLSLILTRAMRDSAVAAATGKGVYHLIVSSGAGSRNGDSTSVPAGAYEGYLWSSAGDNNVGSTSEAWADTMTAAGDIDIRRQFTWALFTVNADVITVEVFRTWKPRSASHPQFTGAGSHRLIHRAYLRRDVD